MPIVESLIHSQPRNTENHSHRAVLQWAMYPIAAFMLVACSQQANDSATTNVSPIPKVSASSPTLTLSGPKWQDLTNAQRLILQPLSTTWDSLGSVSKSKWIAIAASYPTRTPAEQQRLQERMVDWTALTPAERERARLNFAGTKKLSPTERAADWEAYQGLTSQEKTAFAKVGGGKPAGAAVAVIPVSPDKLTPVPVTRRTPALEDSAVVARPSLNPKTLLPAPVVLPEPAAAAATVPAVAPEVAPGSQVLDKSLTIN